MSDLHDILAAEGGLIGAALGPKPLQNEGSLPIAAISASLVGAAACGK